MLSDLRGLWPLLCVLAGMGLSGCSGSTDEIVARVDGRAITTAQLTHWAGVWSGGRSSSIPGGHAGAALMRRALAYLIGAYWLTGEASRQGVAPTPGEVRSRMAQRTAASFPGGRTEFGEFLKATGQSAAGIELEIQAELASSHLYRATVAKVPKVTPAQVAAYYAQHRNLFFTPEVREYELTNRKTRAAADSLIQKVRAGASFAALCDHRKLERPVGVTAANALEPLAKAVYRAKLHVLTGPIVQGPDYNLLEITRIVASRPQALDQVAPTVTAQLQADALEQTVTAAVTAWRLRWTAKTTCARGYVVQKCDRYLGSRTSESPHTYN